MNRPQASMTGQTRMEVPLLDLKAQYAPIRSRIEAVIQDVCNSQHFIMGPKVSEFEEQIAAYVGSEFGIGVSSGTDALLIALMALDIGPGDDVITTPFTFFATGGVIARLGARPVFCDIDEQSFNLDPTRVREFLTNRCKRVQGVLTNTSSGNRVRVLMPVHLFGQMADMTSLGAIAEEYGLQIVEDAAQAIGARDESNNGVGTIGDIACLSFFPSKNLGAFGDGGMCVTNNSDLAEKMKVLRVHGGKPKYYHEMIGGNFRLDAIQAAILSVKLPLLDTWTRQRTENAARYDCLFSGLPQRVRVPTVRQGSKHVFNQYTIRVENRDSLRAHLNRRTVGTEIYYPVPLHLQQCFKYLGYSAGDFPVAETASESVLSLPIYSELTESQQCYVVDECAAWQHDQEPV